MNLKVYLITCAAAVLLVTGAYYDGHRKGWDEGRAALVSEQQAKAQAQLAKRALRQQANDSKAAAADEYGKTKTITITQEVIRYVKTPGRNVCTFDTDRLSIKRAAVDNANSLAGYDDAAVQTFSAGGQR